MNRWPTGAAATCAAWVACACATTSLPEGGLEETDVASLAVASERGRSEEPARAEARAQGPEAKLLGAWKGAIVVADVPVYVTVHLEPGKEGGVTGSLDIPEIDAADEPVANIALDHDRVRFELPGEPVPGVFEARLAGERMQGRFTYLDVDGVFWAERIKGTSPTARAAYREEDVTVRSGEVTLAGTLTVPRGRGRHPAVLLVSGAGPKARDRVVAGFPLFQVLAHELTRAGYAVLRLDDRGAGASSGDLAKATREDLARDVLASVRFLKKRRDVDSGRIGLIGFSEGTLVAPLAAVNTEDIAFLVLLGGTGLSGEEVLLRQSEALLESSGLPIAEIQEQLSFQQQLIENIRADRGWDDLEESLYLMIRAEYEQLPLEEQVAMGDIDLWARAAAAEQIATVKSPWFRSFLTYDPGPALRRTEVPVLAVFGELDGQVQVEDNANAMRQAFARGQNQGAVVAVVPGANHLMQKAETGAIEEYPALEPDFHPAFTKLLVAWLDEQAETPQKLSLQR